MIKINLLRKPFPSDTRSIFFPIYFNSGKNFIWLEIRHAITGSFYSTKKVKNIEPWKAN